MVDTGWEPKKDNLRGCFMDDFQEDGNLLWYSYLENPMDGGAWWATVHGVTKESDMTERLHVHFLSGGSVTS